MYRDENGKNVRYAKCKVCKTTLSAKSSGGTGHLLRHRTSCLAKSDRSARVQSILQYNSDGSVRSWDYSTDVARTELCRMIVCLDLPLGIGGTDAFERYIKRAHNPRFASVSRQTTTRDFAKFYNARRAVLMESLQNHVSSIALTSDIWSGNAKEDYLSVVAHFVNVDWELEKRVLGMRLIDVAHSGPNIADRVAMVIDEFGLTDKVFAVTLDNASSNVNAMVDLRKKFSGYVGPLFLHQRCACHIINLIVKSGLKRLKTCIEAFRTAISFLNASNTRIAAYKSYCIAMGARPRKFGLDMDVRWNSTYLMLKHLLPHKSTFDVFIQTQYRQVTGKNLLTKDDWYVAEKILEFLELFYEATVALSGIYYPTSSLMLHQLIEIAGHLHKYEHDKLLGPSVGPMKAKYLKYWQEIPVLYSVAFILDPRAKLRGFNNALLVLSKFTGVDYSSYYTTIKTELSNIFSKYESKFGAVRLQKPTPTSAGRKKTAWSKIFSSDGDVDLDSFASMTSTPCTSYSAQVSELNSYLDADPLLVSDDDLDILVWWQEHKQTYPVLSILAKDVLTVPVSTISSESTFSLTGRVLEERRRRLTPEMVEILTCLKDWQLGEDRAQHSIETYQEDFEKQYKNLYIDGGEDAIETVELDPQPE